MKFVHAAFACGALLLSSAVFADGTSQGTQASLSPSTNRASADTDTSGFIAAGAGVAPAFEGSDEYDAIPLFFGSLDWRGTHTELRGLGFSVDLLGNSQLDIGPIFNYRVERDSSDGSGRVRRLEDVDGAAELGGFIGYRFGGKRHGDEQIEMNLSAVQDVSDTHDGLLITGHVAYAALRTRALSIHVDAQTTWADEDYQRTYFGISPSNAARSGLRVYGPDSGFRDVTAGVTFAHQFNDRWGALLRVSATRYVGDTADSPIVRAGSKTVGLIGVAASYRF